MDSIAKPSPPPPDDIDRIARQLIEEAKAGDVPAARLVLQLVFGKPTSSKEK